MTSVKDRNLKPAAAEGSESPSSSANHVDQALARIDQALRIDPSTPADPVA